MKCDYLWQKVKGLDQQKEETKKNYVTSVHKNGHPIFNPLIVVQGSLIQMYCMEKSSLSFTA